MTVPESLSVVKRALQPLPVGESSDRFTESLQLGVACPVNCIIDWLVRAES
jgi:hypothetical protein